MKKFDKLTTSMEATKKSQESGKKKDLRFLNYFDLKDDGSNTMTIRFLPSALMPIVSGLNVLIALRNLSV